MDVFGSIHSNWNRGGGVGASDKPTVETPMKGDADSEFNAERKILITRRLIRGLIGSHTTFRVLDESSSGMELRKREKVLFSSLE